jgi:DNA replication ATP-dependent helicase Dna2
MAILEGGYDWEEQVVGSHLAGRIHTARPSAATEALRDRSHTAAATLRLLSRLRPGESIYQGTLVAPPSFLARYGIDPALLQLPGCRPDLIELTVPLDAAGAPMAPRLRVIDVKASEALKASHRVQVALYTLMRREIVAEAGLAISVDLETGGVWLYGQVAPEWFPLSMTTGVLEAFLRERLPAILTATASEVAWHLFFPRRARVRSLTGALRLENS